MKKTTTILAAAGLAAAGAFAGVATASAENAPGLTTAEIGEQAKLQNGDVVQGWTIADLKPSTDAIPYEVRGTLWEATATDEALQGSVIPIVSNLNARAEDGQTYRALFQVATPQGVNPEALAQGESTTGKVYFDVTGQAPDSVVYNDGGHDLAIWVEPAETSVGDSGVSAPARTQPAPAAAEATDDTEATDTEGTDTEGTDTEGTDTEGTEDADGTEDTDAEGVAGEDAEGAEGAAAGEPVPAGSQGTPLPAGAEGAPAPAEAGAAGTEGEAVPPAAGETAPGVQSESVPTGSQGTPLLPDASARPAGVGGQGAPLPDAPHGPASASHGTAPAPAS